jgi:hypothetical protein
MARSLSWVTLSVEIKEGEISIWENGIGSSPRILPTEGYTAAGPMMIEVRHSLRVDV